MAQQCGSTVYIKVEVGVKKEQVSIQIVRNKRKDLARSLVSSEELILNSEREHVLVTPLSVVFCLGERNSRKTKRIMCSRKM